MSNSVLINGSVRVYSHEMALKIGMNEAILLQQVHYWLQISEHEFKGRKWVYNSYKDWHEQFPYWSLSTVKRVVIRLEKMGLLLSANFNRLKIDRTKWYSIDYSKVQELVGDLEEEKTEDAYLIESLWANDDELDEPFICSNEAEECTSESPAIPKSTSKITTKKEKNKQKNEVIAEVIDYLNKKTNSAFKVNVQKNRQVILARLNEGFTLDDFKKVVDTKTEEWSGDRYWSRYLRPTTLFGTRFDGYLNQKHGSSDMREEDFDLRD